MPLLKPIKKSAQRKPISVQIKGNLADMLDKYSSFLDNTPKASIVEQALEHVFEKDKEFQTFLNKDSRKEKQVIDHANRKAKGNGSE